MSFARPYLHKLTLNHHDCSLHLLCQTADDSTISEITSVIASVVLAWSEEYDWASRAVPELSIVPSALLECTEGPVLVINDLIVLEVADVAISLEEDLLVEWKWWDGGSSASDWRVGRNLKECAEEEVQEGEPKAHLLHRAEVAHCSGG